MHNFLGIAGYLITSLVDISGQEVGVRRARHSFRSTGRQHQC